MTTITLPSATVLLERALHRLAAGALPWTSHSQHDAYLAGYRDGLRDGVARAREGAE